MKLTPVRILNLLGFDVTADGVDINPADAFLITQSLILAGETIDTARISDTKLKEFASGLHIIGLEPINLRDDAALRQRQWIEAILKAKFHKRN